MAFVTMSGVVVVTIAVDLESEDVDPSDEQRICDLALRDMPNGVNFELPLNASVESIQSWDVDTIDIDYGIE